MHSSLSLTGKRWIIKKQTPLSLEDCLSILRSERNLSESTALSDPFLFPEMQKAVDRLERAIANRETIGIFGDYDADGVTGTAILVRALRRRGADPVVHLPDRMKEGYGMKEKSVRALAEKGVTLLLTVDTGIAAHREIALAAELGMDTIVTDHHRDQDGKPPAYAIIHPGLDQFPNTDLCGAGVALMFVRALEKGEVWKGIDEDIVLATIGTIGDVMPLTGENRLLVIHGLKAIPRLAPGPLKELITSVQGKNGITSGDIAFRVVPRINAAGRMAHPDIALRALLEGGQALEKLHMLNGDRRTLVSDVSEELTERIDLSKPFLCIGSPSITPGIAGLVASKLTESHGKPSLAAAFLGDYATASLRSVPEVDCMQCLTDEEVRPFLQTFGGHAQAAGCTFAVADFQKLQDALCRVVGNLTDPTTLVPTHYIDAELADTPTLSFIEALDTLAPFGQGNKEPLFLSTHQKLTNFRTVGSENAHLQCSVASTKAVGFHLGTLLSELNAEREYDCIFRVQKNEWNGKREVQLVLEDIRPSV